MGLRIQKSWKNKEFCLGQLTPSSLYPPDLSFSLSLNWALTVDFRSTVFAVFRIRKILSANSTSSSNRADNSSSANTLHLLLVSLEHFNGYTQIHFGELCLMDVRCTETR